MLAAIADDSLRARIEATIATLTDRSGYGLLYERHLPETVIVGDKDPLEIGDHVRPKLELEGDEDFRILSLDGKTARIKSLKTGEEKKAGLDELLVVKRFGDPAYAGLQSLGSVCRSAVRPFHAVVNGENYHALQALTMIYEGQADCIYIDPPYNSGAADWKYNNNFIDINDTFRHSKWLSFMEKRLRLAKRLLKQDGVLIVTIDENEVNALGLLLEEIFPEYQRTMVTIVINPKGTARANFARVEEYAFFVVPQTPGGPDVIVQLPGGLDQPEHVPAEEELERDAEDYQNATAPETAPLEEEEDVIEDVAPTPADQDDSEDEVEQHFSVLYLRRRGAESSSRQDRWRQFYAIYVNESTRQVEGIGPLLQLGDPYDVKRDGAILTVYPIDSEGNERVWRYGRDTMATLIDKGEIRVGKHNRKQDTYTLNHWKPVSKEKVGLQKVRTVWWRTSHDAGTHGTTLITRLLGKRNPFPFPKSLYAVRDTLETVVKNRPDALIIDFFAGSGTTLHATMLLNEADGGNRRCIIVTNNEVAKKQAAKLNEQGHYRTDPEFERHGIFKSATRPRIEAAVTGERPDGSPMPDTKSYRYLDGRSFGQGFEENVEFFRLDYLDGDRVDLGLEFEGIHPLLWLAAGARGTRPKVKERQKYLLSPEGGYAILFDDLAFTDFRRELEDEPSVTHVFLISDSDEAYAEMREALGRKRTTMLLYRDFLRHYRRRARS
ncbi:MAG: site-specific DNA-methyltransferase [Solirubrobacteraceae bacterium]